MAGFTANWLWVLIFIAFIGRHMLGHGGHSGHREAIINKERMKG